MSFEKRSLRIICQMQLQKNLIINLGMASMDLLGMSTPSKKGFVIFWPLKGSKTISHLFADFRIHDAR